MPLAIVLVGFCIGVLVGRWWALVAAIAVGVWIASTSDVDEVSPAFLGTAYAVLSAVGIGVGILIRRHAGRTAHQREPQL